MVCPKLPKDIWRHIRRFSSDTAYDGTPTADLMHDLCFRDDSCGRFMFDYGLDGYSSTIITI